MSMPIRAAYLGPPASYTHQAAKQYFASTPDVVLEPYVTFPSIFAAVQSGTVTHGIVPIENSSNGSVVQVFDLLADRSAEHGDVRVVAEQYFKVEHCLLWKPDTWQPNEISTEESSGINEPYGGIKKIYTHPQAWGQCSSFLERCFRGVERADVSSTSKAAEIVAHEGPGSGSAAIASRLAGELHGLDTLAVGIQDRDDNVTRFFVLRKSSDGDGADGAVNGEQGQVNYKFLISFTIDHAVPGALANALGVFKQYDFNLTSIDTRPSRVRPWHYVFFVECEQRARSERGNIDGVMGDLKNMTENRKLLGRFADGLEATTGSLTGA